MHKYFVSPSATNMILDLLLDLPRVKASPQCWRLVLAACLLAGVATSRPLQCSCWQEAHTVRCAGCSRLPQKLPAGVSRLNLTGNRVPHIHFAANVSSTLADVTTVYLNSNNIRSLHYGDLCPLKRLMVLDLSANNLESVEEHSIACNDQLKRLVLDDNPQLHLVALRSRSLEDLYLQNCGLTSFDQELLKHLPKLRGLYLRSNDALPCGQVVQDLRKHWPHLDVYCDVKTTATKNTSTTTTATAASDNRPKIRTTGYSPRFGIWDGPSEGLPSQTQDAVPHEIQLVAPIPVVPLIVILVAVLVAVLFRFCQKHGREVRPGDESGGGSLLEEPH